jgi:osmotically inducible protein OsmC
MKRSASAQWRGDLKSGNGSVTATSGAFSNLQYSFHTRFEEGKGTNPEELLAAAHAGCFSMALSAQLGAANLKPDAIDTTCEITLERQPDGFAITASHLNVTARIPGATKEAFDRAVLAAKTGCPVSKLYKAEITVTATLEGSGLAGGAA